MTPSPAGVMVAGIGNLFLGDDGFGPEVVRHLAADPARLPEGVRLVDYGIRGMHLAYDLLAGFSALVLIDAVPGSGPPGELTVLQIGPEDLGQSEFDAHGMAPVAVLAAVPSLGGELPPTYLVGCRPADWSEGIGLSEAVRDAVPAAAEAVRTLVGRLVAGRATLAEGG
jgi:hydrogenase maturation protease